MAKVLFIFFFSAIVGYVLMFISNLRDRNLEREFRDLIDEEKKKSQEEDE